MAQAASTLNGRILDQGDAVLPGVTVTVANEATGVVRTTVSNEEGLYFLPGLYTLRTELPGFAPSARERVQLFNPANLGNSYNGNGRSSIQSVPHQLAARNPADPLFEQRPRRVLQRAPVE
jgi:hypothetical protein